MLHIYLVGSHLLYILLGTATAQPLSFVAVDVEETTAMVCLHGIFYLIAEERIGLFLGRIDIGGTVHDGLIVRYAQCLLKMGETLEVGHHKGVVGILKAGKSTVARNVGIKFIVKGVFGVVIAEI